MDPQEAHRRLDALAAADAAVAATRLTARSAAWAARLGTPFDPALAALCCLSPAFVTPWLSPPGAFLTARTALWIFAVDAWSDGAAPDARPVREGIAGLRRVVHGAAPPAGPLAAALAEIRDELAARRWGATIMPWWRRAADAALAGTWFEYDAARRVATGGPAPPLADYLRHGAGSIAFAMLVLAMWADMDDPLPASLGALHRPLHDASLAVRLANDLRGRDRERAEGVLNALSLGLSARAAGDRIDRHVARCVRRLRPMTERVPGPALALERLLLWSVRHYQRFDAGHHTEPPPPGP